MTEMRILKIVRRRAIRLSELKWRLKVSYDELWEALRPIKDEVDVVPAKNKSAFIMVRKRKENG